MTRSILCLAAFVFTQSATAQPVGQQNPDPLSSAADALMRIHDRNGDRQLNADECPPIFRDKFATIDLNHDGYLVSGELMSALAQRPVRRGRQREWNASHCDAQRHGDVDRGGRRRDEHGADLRRRKHRECFGLVILDDIQFYVQCLD